MKCPECNDEMDLSDDERFPECLNCGFVQYDADTLALQAEIRREQAAAKKVLGYVPSYGEAIEKGFCR